MSKCAKCQESRKNLWKLKEYWQIFLVEKRISWYLLFDYHQQMHLECFLRTSSVLAHHFVGIFHILGLGVILRHTWNWSWWNWWKIRESKAVLYFLAANSFDFTRKNGKIFGCKKLVKTTRFCPVCLLTTLISREKLQIFFI